LVCFFKRVFAGLIGGIFFNFKWCLKVQIKLQNWLSTITLTLINPPQLITHRTAHTHSNQTTFALLHIHIHSDKLPHPSQPCATPKVILLSIRTHTFNTYTHTRLHEIIQIHNNKHSHTYTHTLIYWKTGKREHGLRRNKEETPSSNGVVWAYSLCCWVSKSSCILVFRRFGKKNRLGPAYEPQLMNSVIDCFLLAHNQALVESVVLDIVIFVSQNLPLPKTDLTIILIHVLKKCWKSSYINALKKLDRSVSRTLQKIDNSLI
jgi:hypothetical protein